MSVSSTTTNNCCFFTPPPIIQGTSEATDGSSILAAQPYNQFSRIVSQEELDRMIWLHLNSNNMPIYNLQNDLNYFFNLRTITAVQYFHPSNNS